MIIIFLYLLLGLVAGILSGLIGVGGGVIIIPALVFLFGLSQHQAQGTTLALMVPPIGLLAA
ncbi:MAG: TSUP family transporter, partial [Planctomycetota bacterium]|nr:TSUP family transporter [Planctomycetota bacterium]